MNNLEKRIEQLERSQRLTFQLLFVMFPALGVALTVATKSQTAGLFAAIVLLIGLGIIVAKSKKNAGAAGIANNQMQNIASDAANSDL